MLALPLVLHLALASPGAAPGLVTPLQDPGPFQGSELVASALGVAAGDALVLGAGYATLQLFASGTLEPSARNFRRTAYALGVAALVVPPLTAALLARWARAEPASGSFGRAFLLALLGEAAAIGVGLLAAPHLWVILPAQVLAVGLATTLGLHWGPRRTVAPSVSPAPEGAPAGPDRSPAAAARAEPLCPDPALAIRAPAAT